MLQPGAPQGGTALATPPVRGEPPAHTLTMSASPYDRTLRSRDAGSVGARHSLAQQESPRHSRNWQQYHAPVDGDPLEVPANFSWADGMALGSFADDDGIDLGPLDLSN